MCTSGPQQTDQVSVNEVMSGVGNVLDGILYFIRAEQEVTDDWLRDAGGY